jgi:hypothetical protein
MKIKGRSRHHNHIGNLISRLGHQQRQRRMDRAASWRSCGNAKRDIADINELASIISYEQQATSKLSY